MKRPAAPLLSALVLGLTLLGLGVAVARPPALTAALQGVVEQAGAAAPLVYVLLCALTAPLHLNGVLVACSSLLWPLPTALALSYLGSLLGALLTVGLLLRLGGADLHAQQGWPAWLRRLALGVERRPLLVGLLARIGLGSGLALEAFYLATGYSRRLYLGVTALGLLVWVGQALVGVTLLHRLLEVSPVLAAGAAGLPLLLSALVLGWQARARSVRR